MPEIVIVDEIGTEAEALACRTIAERGVQLIATAHGQLLENLLKNPTLSDLVGGIQSVTLGARNSFPLCIPGPSCCLLTWRRKCFLLCLHKALPGPGRGAAVQWCPMGTLQCAMHLAMRQPDTLW